MKVRDFVKKYKLVNSKWVHKGFHGVLHTFFPVGQGGIYVNEFISKTTPWITFFSVKNNYVDWYWNDRDLTNVRNVFFKRLVDDKNYLKKLQLRWVSSLNDFDNILSSIEKFDLKLLSADSLIKLYNRFYQVYLEEFKQFMILGDAVSMQAEKYLIPIFKKVLKSDFDSIFPQLLVTKHKSFIEEESIDRQKIINQLRQEKKLSLNVFSRHAHNYFYIQNNYAKGDQLTADDFKKIIKADLKHKSDISPTVSKRQQLRIKNQLIKKYKLSSFHKQLLYVMDEFFGIQDTRKKYVLISNYFQFVFLQEAARRSRIPLELLKYTVFPEYSLILSKKINIQTLKQRAKFCVCINTIKGYEVLAGTKAKKVANYLKDVKNPLKVIKGMTASMGIFKGRVRLILKIHDMVNMNKGDILVTSMTRPEMVPVMKLAGAIITDEGGVTSHAAIISRELHIPCIIGTKLATQVLKDGDMVEVDANKGIVKIL